MESCVQNVETRQRIHLSLCLDLLKFKALVPRDKISLSAVKSEKDLSEFMRISKYFFQDPREKKDIRIDAHYLKSIGVRTACYATQGKLSNSFRQLLSSFIIYKKSYRVFSPDCLRTL